VKELLGPVLCVALCAVACAGCGVTEVVGEREGRAILIRTPQPDAGDLRELHAEHGVKTVLNLRGEQPERDWFKEEGIGVRAIKAQWVHLPVSGSHPPKPDELRVFFALVEDPQRWPIVVHCQGGIHRTGAFIALFRIQYEGWSGDRAVEEMEDRYFNWTTRDRSEIKEWLRRYRRDPAHSLPQAARTE
jgi:protein tyrosine/serine phosphatase